MTIIDLFAGCGGADLGMRALGLDPVGFEMNAHACATRAAAGLHTIRADLEQYPPRGRVEGLWASPPCQDFSAAGKRLGRTGSRGRLVDIPPYWVDILRPRWVACEEVPPVLPIWYEHAAFYRELGYRTWVGVLNCADYGLPQTRERAILLASLDITPAPPEPTHEENPHPSLFGPELEPWVSMADALGWGLTQRPGYTFCGGNDGGPDIAAGSGARNAIRAARDVGAWVDTRGDSGRRHDSFSAAWPSRSITSKSDSWTLSTGDGFGGPKYERVLTAPAPTVDAKAGGGAWMIGPAGHRETHIAGKPRGVVKVTLADVLKLQGFPADFPLRGTKTSQFLQVGNAVPPVLAERCVEQFVQ